MPDPRTPGVYVEELPSPAPRIEWAKTAVTAFLGRTLSGPVEDPVGITSLSQFERLFGPLSAELPLGHAIRQFFENGGAEAVVVRLFENGGQAFAGNPPQDDGGPPLASETFLGDEDRQTGLYTLTKADSFNLLVIPPDGRLRDDVPVERQFLDPAIVEAAAKFCSEQRAFFIADPPAAWIEAANRSAYDEIDLRDARIRGSDRFGSKIGRNSAVYFPRIEARDPVNGESALYPPSAAIAGIYARTDMQEGPWKAPAGTNADFIGVTGFDNDLGDTEQALLNPLGINGLRAFPQAGPVIWGARTMRGADRFGDEFKYVPVRRTFLMVEQSVIRGMDWTVFEPNDERLWQNVRSRVEEFVRELHRSGALYEYFVRCDRTTMTQSDVDAGIVKLVIGLALVKPGEFIVSQIDLKAASA